jgi:hypothetical protein
MAKIDTKPTPTPTLTPIPSPDEKSPSTVTYRDLAFKSRTLVLADGRSFDVAQGSIQTGDTALIAFLEKHPEFQREPDSAAGV